MTKAGTTRTFDAFLAHLQALDRSRRRIVAITGAPGSGKSTFVERLRDALNAGAPGLAAVVPMDGFHFDDGLLRQMGRLAFKGAPDTFDAGGLAALLVRLRANTERQIAIPLFDRTLEISRAGAAMVDRSVQIVLVEGNYLLLATDPWAGLRRFFDLTATLDVPEDTLRRRLTERWQGYGLSPEDIARKIDGVDLPNGRKVRDGSIAPDLFIGNG